MSGLIGSLVGGLMALGGVILQNNHHQSAAREAEAELIRGLLGAVAAELAVLWERYEKRVGQYLRTVPEGAFFNFSWPTSRNYFTVYEANAGLLGRIPDPTIRTEIVEAYTYAKGTLDSIWLNAEMVGEIDELQRSPARAAPEVRARIAFLQDAVVRYARMLKDSDAELKGRIESPLPKLKPAAPNDGCIDGCA